MPDAIVREWFVTDGARLANAATFATEQQWDTALRDCEILVPHSLRLEVVAVCWLTARGGGRGLRPAAERVIVSRTEHWSMTLAEAIAKIEDAGDDAVIFARKPWSPSAESLIAPLDHDLKIPQSVEDAGFDYFLEAPLVSEVCEVFMGRAATLDEKVRLLLYYAENDAYPEWVYSRSDGNAV